MKHQRLYAEQPLSATTAHPLHNPSSTRRDATSLSRAAPGPRSQSYRLAVHLLFCVLSVLPYISLKRFFWGGGIMAKRNEFSDSPVWRKASSPVSEGLMDGGFMCRLTFWEQPKYFLRTKTDGLRGIPFVIKTVPMGNLFRLSISNRCNSWKGVHYGN